MPISGCCRRAASAGFMCGAVLGLLVQGGRGLSSTIRSANGHPPSAEGDKVQLRALQARPKDGARLAALRSPFGNLRAPTYKQYQNPTSAGRGGSVSRRDHNQAAGNHANLSGGTNFAEATAPNASYSSGGGPGEGLLLEKPPPPEFPTSGSFLLRIAAGRLVL